MHPKTERIAALLAAAGLTPTVVELPESTRTAAEAAVAVGSTVAQIAKSLVFVAHPSGRVVLVVASGTNRVDVGKISAIVGSEIDRPDAKSVKVLTGYSIGGVPPFGHGAGVETLVDEDLLVHTEIWGAAGTPHAVCRVTPQELVLLADGVVCDVRVDPDLASAPGRRT